MGRLALPACLLAAVVWGGCDPTGLIGRADRFMRTGHPDQALEQYRKALEEDPDLTEKKKFMAKLDRARSRSAYRAGEKLAADGKWEQAVEQFAESLSIEPDFANAREAYDKVARQAARVRYERALKLADEGKGQEAVAELKRAVELDDDNADAARALALSTGSGRAYPGPAADLYDKGAGLQQQKRWRKAAGALTEAIRIDPNHVLARVALHRGGESMARARQACGDARALLEARQLAQAAAMAERALGIWPDCPEAPAVAAAGRTRLAKAEGLYAKAREHAGRSNWTAAAQTAAAALDVFPAHAGAKEVLEGVAAKAAEAHAKAGRTALAKGDLFGACLHLRRAARYEPDSAPVRADLAEVCRRQAASAEKAGRWGGALLWHMEAIDADAASESISGVARSTRKVAERVRFSLDVSVRDAAGKRGVASEALSKEVLAALVTGKPDFVDVVAAPAGGASDYSVAVKLLAIDVQQKLLKTESKRHAYTIRQEALNPEIPILAGRLRAKQLELDILKRQLSRPCLRCAGTGRRVCRSCRGRGTQRCVNCGGDGEVRCKQCGGSGSKPDGTVCRRCKGDGRARCLICSGSGRSPCQTCSQLGQRRGWLTCGRCGGRGRAAMLGPWDMVAKERELKSLERRLRNAPTKVVRKTPAEWAYTQRQYRKSGMISTDLRVTSGESVVRSERVRKTFTARDTVIEGANPSVGLAADGLDLPDDAAVRKALIRAAAGQIALKVLPAVTRDRIEQTRLRAERLAKAGKALEAAEARMDLIHLLKPTRAKEAAGLLAEARTEHAERESD